MGVHVPALAILGAYFILLVVAHEADHLKGKEEKPVLKQDIDVEQFLKSYNYFNQYEASPKRLTHESLGYITPVCLTSFGLFALVEL